LSKTGAAAIAILVASAGIAFAQFGRGFGGRDGGIRLAPAVMPDAKFTICRIMLEEVRTFPASGAGWRTDYPYGDMNLMIRFSELTRTPVSFDSGRRPNHYRTRCVSFVTATGA
jgi:hypothetical protein